MMMESGNEGRIPLPAEANSPCAIFGGVQQVGWAAVALIAVEQYDTRRYFRFADGWTVWTPNESAPPKALRA